MRGRGLDRAGSVAATYRAELICTLVSLNACEQLINVWSCLPCRFTSICVRVFSVYGYEFWCVSVCVCICACLSACKWNRALNEKCMPFILFYFSLVWFFSPQRPTPSHIHTPTCTHSFIYTHIHTLNHRISTLSKQLPLKLQTKSFSFTSISKCTLIGKTKHTWTVSRAAPDVALGCSKI